LESRARIRVDFSARGFEIEGSEEFVANLFDRIMNVIGSTAAQAGSVTLGEIELDSELEPERESSSQATASSMSHFGEMLHSLPRSATDVDRVLIAGLYIQQNNQTATFQTADVNKLLRDHGIKVSNPSQSIKNNEIAKRLFSVQRGKFRVSRVGVEYVNQLMQGA
jgi:hypothetical protein